MRLAAFDDPRCGPTDFVILQMCNDRWHEMPIYLASNNKTPFDHWISAGTTHQLLTRAFSHVLAYDEAGRPRVYTCQSVSRPGGSQSYGAIPGKPSLAVFGNDVGFSALLKLDRLGRFTRDVLNLVHELDQKGASLRILEPEVSTAGPLGRMVVTVLGMVAEMELGFIRDRRLASRRRRPRASTRDDL